MDALEGLYTGHFEHIDNGGMFLKYTVAMLTRIIKNVNSLCQPISLHDFTTPHEQFAVVFLSSQLNLLACKVFLDIISAQIPSHT